MFVEKKIIRECFVRKSEEMWSILGSKSEDGVEGEPIILEDCPSPETEEDFIQLSNAARDQVLRLIDSPGVLFKEQTCILCSPRKIGRSLNTETQKKLNCTN